MTSGSKYVSVNKSGLVTIKRWTPKGTYKISVTAKATEEYKDAAKTVTVQVKAAKKAVMSTIPMTWDLKNNKTVKYKTMYGVWNYPKVPSGIFKEGSLTVKNLKKTSVSSGKKYKVTYTLRFVTPTKFKQSEINHIISYGSEYGDWGSVGYGAVLDYQTGESLKRKNSYGVKVTFGKWKGKGTNKYNGSNGGWFSEPKVEELKVSIVYPKDYKDLCIVAGGVSRRGDFGNKYTFYNSATECFNGNVLGNPIAHMDEGADAYYSKKYKTVCHGMRVK